MKFSLMYNFKDKTWLKNPKILYHNLTLSSFIPNKLDKDLNFNAISRIIFLLLFITLLSNFNLIFYIIIILLIFIVYFYENSRLTKPKTKNSISRKYRIFSPSEYITVRPTYSNPFMNNNCYSKRNEVANVYIDNNTDRRPKSNNKKDDILNKIFNNTDDIYGRESSQRQFYTVPKIDDQNHFAEWLYEMGPTLKEQNLQKR